MVYRLPAALSRLPVPSRATRSTFPSRPYRFPVSSRAVRPTFPPRPCRFPAASRADRPTFPPRSCQFPALSRDFRPTFPFVRLVSRCGVRYSFGVFFCPSRLRFCPVSRFLRTVLSAFLRVLLYSTNIFAL